MKEFEKSLLESGIFPLSEVSREAVREKNIRQGGHPSTLHIWWARRPLASARTAIYSLLIPTPSDPVERERKRQSIANLAKWENSNDLGLIRKAREEILRIWGKPPRVLDPFAGGGSLPLEALRLGYEAHALEYNPVAVLILKCTLEYPQKFRERGRFGSYKLIEDVEKWGNWILERAKEEIGEFYPADEDGSTPIAYIWARTLPCQNPACGAEIPLMRQFWLANSDKRKIALRPIVRGKRVEFEIVHNPNLKAFDPNKGTVARAIVTCPVCGYTIDDETTRRLFREGKGGKRLVAVVTYKKGEGKNYRLATERDFEIFKKAEKYLEEKRQKLREEWGFDPVPDEELPLMSGVFNVPLYGFNKWDSLFNSRQKLTLITLVEQVRKVYEEMRKEGQEGEYAKAVASYLALAVSRVADWLSSLCRWQVHWEMLVNTFARQALPMVWDYGELNPLSVVGAGTFKSMHGQIIAVLNYLFQIPLIEANGQSITPQVKQGSATELPYPDEYFDAVFTDPPYYNSIPYADLSDFFYVWLKRMLWEIHPELFATPLAPKTKEIVEMAGWDPQRYKHKDKIFFEENLKKSFKEIRRVLKQDGIALIIYAHQSTSGWESLVQALLDCGLLPIITLPINTEQAERLRALGSASLASSLFIACRKTEKQGIGWLREVKEELANYLPQRLRELWKEGIRGADFLIAGIGIGIEVFGKYEKVMDAEGNLITADKLLDLVRAMVADFALREVLHDGIANRLSPLTRFYLLWRHIYKQASVEFDDARKLAQAVGIDLASEWNKGFIKKEGKNIRLLTPLERNRDELWESDELIDVLHLVLLLWKEGRKGEILDVLNLNGYGGDDSLFKVAQSISSSLPLDDAERRLLDGFLAGSEKFKGGALF
ncbi:DUF1156 domain-containing protein [bacterium]|nr:DUF1156 domain-containing protein [bacterium]